MKSISLFSHQKQASTSSKDSDTLSEGPSAVRRNNPQLEKYRNSLKNSLFTADGPQSLQAICTQSLPTEDNERAESIGPVQKAKSRSPFHSRLDKMRNSVKGSLLMLSSANESPLSNSGEGTRKKDRIGLIRPLLVPSSGSPTLDGSSKADEDSSPSIVQEMDSFIAEKNEDVSLSPNSESPRLGEKEEKVLEENEVIVVLPQNSIFLDVLESEIKEVKAELKIDESCGIYFIKGDFVKYYKEGTFLGEGTSGIVKKCVKNETNENFAVKIIQYKGDREILTLILHEFQNLKKLDHKNVIKVYELYVDVFKKKIYTIMELANCSEMFEVLKDLGHYSEAVASGIMKQILTGINYLHKNGVCHRDIKPNNILVSQDGKIVKITDFNVSKFLDKKDSKKNYSSLSTQNYKMWTYTGTIAFTAPEVFVDNEYTESVDVWSTGVVLYTMLCGYQPFQAETVTDLIELIKQGKYTLEHKEWESISERAKDLIKHCLDVNVKTRYSPAQALMHPWIANRGNVSNTQIAIRDNFRVYYKKYKGHKKDAEFEAMKKVQVTSPNLAVASPASKLLKKRSGTMRLDLFDFKEKPAENVDGGLRTFNKLMMPKRKDTIQSVQEDMSEESPIHRPGIIDTEELELLNALSKDNLFLEGMEGHHMKKEADKALHEIVNNDLSSHTSRNDLDLSHDEEGKRRDAGKKDGMCVDENKQEELSDK